MRKKSETQKSKIDHDRLFKELIVAFFWEFLQLFLPEVIQYVEPQSIQFLRQEILTELLEGETRKVDLVVQVKFPGKDAFFIIHIEHQSTAESRFNRRMFHYFARIHEKFGLPVYPILICSYDPPRRPEKSVYTVEFPDRKVLSFSYVVIQLNRLNWRDFLQNENPVAAALMAKMSIKPEDRPKVKAECLRMLVTLELNPAKMRFISGFVDTYLRLDEQEEETFQAELNKMGLVEQETVMEIVTSWMEEGIERGRKEGRQEGRKQGRKEGQKEGRKEGLEQGLQQGLQREISLVLRLLNRRLGPLSPAIETQVRNLPLEQLENLGEALLDFQTESDLTDWLAQH